VKGFPILRREYIADLDEAFTLKYRIQAFRGGQDQRYYENRFTIKDREGNRHWTEQQMKNNQLSLWRYEPRVDIDNDGQPDEVLGYRDNRCDSTRPIFNGLFIVDPKTLLIDEEKTRRLFGEPRPYPVETATFIPLRAGQLGLFQYSGRNYIYSWGTDEAWTKRKNPPTTSRVYLRQGDKVGEVCEVRWNPVRE
jgi:hypothetical protein